MSDQGAIRRTLLRAAGQAAALCAFQRLCPAASPQANLKQPMEKVPVTRNSQQYVTYALRQFLGSIPYGNGAGTLPYTHSDMGGATDASLSEMLASAPSICWLRDVKDGAVYAADFEGKKTLRLVLGQEEDVWASAIARDASGGLAALIGYRQRASEPVRFRVGFYPPMKTAASHVIALSAVGGAPQSVGLMPGGEIWISKGPETILFSSTGQQTATIRATGIVLPEGLFLSNGANPALYSSGGRRTRGLTVHGRSGSIRFFASDRHGTLLAIRSTAILPDSFRSVELIDVFQYSEQRGTIELEDRITSPAIVLKTPAPGANPDGSPVHSYFPQSSACLDDNGDLLQLELTDAEARLYRCRRLHPDEEWREKFRHPGDLNSEEIAIATAEYAARARMSGQSDTLARYFAGFAWSQTTSEGHHAESEDPVLRSLQATQTHRR